MRFSIIIPAHNADERIGKILRIIKRQVYDRAEYEVIVICDSCEDLTDGVAETYGAKVKSVEYHRDGLTRNEGIEMAQGEYILFLDDDDWWLSDMTLQIVDDLLRMCKDPDILACGFIWRFRGYALARMYPGGPFWANVWSKVWKRSFIGDTRFTDVEMESDLHFTRAMLEKEPRIEETPFPLVYYNYMRVGSQTELAGREEK